MLTLIPSSDIEVTPERVRRFDRFVSVVPITGCWLWQGPLTSQGYGQFRADPGADSSKVSAHRFAYAAFRGPLTPGLSIDHLCRHRWCVNPAHLEEVSIAENLRRSDGPSGRAARAKHCAQGHPFSHSDGWQRRCRVCQRQQEARRRLRREQHASAPLPAADARPDVVEVR